MKSLTKVKPTIPGKARHNRFRGWDKVIIKNDSGVEKEAIAPVIISASWRTDIPAWHSDWFMERLRRGHMLSTYRQRKYRTSFKFSFLR